MDRKSDVTEWQKKAIVLGRKHRHRLKEEQNLLDTTPSHSQ